MTSNRSRVLLYTVYENGVLRQVKKAIFSKNRVYLIDADTTIYLWFGLEATKKKKDFAMKRANSLNAKKNEKASIQTINQNQEYGAFLALMDVLITDFTKKKQITKRPELELDIGDTLELLEAGLDPDFEAEINMAAYKLSKEGHTYRELCRKLAKIQIGMMKTKVKITSKDITKKAEEIFQSSSTYEEICWLIAQLTILKEKG